MENPSRGWRAARWRAATLGVQATFAADVAGHQSGCVGRVVRDRRGFTLDGLAFRRSSGNHFVMTHRP